MLKKDHWIRENSEGIVFGKLTRAPRPDAIKIDFLTREQQEYLARGANET
jgi:hypothetical protein